MSKTLGQVARISPDLAIPLLKQAHDCGMLCVMCGRPLAAREFCCDGPGRVRSMCPASHGGPSVKLLSLAALGLLAFQVSCLIDQGGAPIKAGSPLHEPHIRRDKVPNPLFPHSGQQRAPRRAAPLFKTRRHRTRPDNGDAPLDWSGQARWSAALADVVSQAAGLSAAPSGTTPCVANRHSAIEEFSRERYHHDLALAPHAAAETAAEPFENRAARLMIR